MKKLNNNKKRYLAADLRRREQGWNDRHHIDQTSRGKNKAYKRPDGASLQKKKEFRQGGRVLVCGKYKQAIKAALNDLRQLWEDSKIPTFHIDIMTHECQSCSDFQAVLDWIQFQSLELKKGQSLIQLTLQDVQTREACLNQLKSLTAQMQPDIQQISQKIIHLKKISIQVVQKITAWRKNYRLNSKNPKLVFPSRQGQNYLIKMQSDFSFLIKLPYINQLPLKLGDPLLGQQGLGNSSIIRDQKVCNAVLQQQVKPDKSPSKAQKQIHKQGRFKGRLKQIDQLRKRIDTQTYPKRIFLKQSQLQFWIKQKSQYCNQLLNYAVSCPNLEQYSQKGIFQFDQKYCLLAVQKNTIQRRVWILQILGKVMPTDIKELLQQLLTHLWNQDSTNQVRVSLRHQQSQSGLAINKAIQTPFRDAGFRWKLVNNNRATGSRSTIFTVHRPSQQMPTHNPSHITVQSIQLARIGILDDRLPQVFVSKINQIYLVGSIDPGSQQNRMSQEINFQAIRTHTFNNQSQLIRAANQNYITLGVIDSFTQQCQSSILSLSFNWLNYSFLNKQKSGKMLRHIILQPDHLRPIKQAVSPNHRSPIYLIPVDQEGYSIFIFQARSITSISQATDVILNTDSQTELQKALQIPVFTKSGKYSRAGRTFHYYLSSDFKSGLNCVRPDEPATSIQGKIVIGMIYGEMLAVIQQPLWIAFIEQKDYIV